MIEFFSASTRMVNSIRAVDECLEAAFGEGQSTDCDLVVLHASMGHRLEKLAARVSELAPSARIVGSSCCGVIGSEGVSESMKDVALMALRGREHIFVSSMDGIYGHNSYEKARALAADLRNQSENINMLYYLSSGIDVANDQAIAGIESVFGPDITIFGATSSDNMRGITSHQFALGKVMENGAFLVGLADPSLHAITQATHGFIATGEPLTVTRSSGNVIHEFDGQPAWEAYTRRLGLPADASCGDTIPLGALAEPLPADTAEEYGNPHVLRVVTRHGDAGDTYYTANCPEGTQLWLTRRDEELIFSEVDRMMNNMNQKAGGEMPVAVFHADCLARGRYLFGSVRKEEIVAHMQVPLSKNGKVPPWLGMYGFGEFARLGGRNEYHNYTTALCAIYRRTRHVLDE